MTRITRIDLPFDAALAAARALISEAEAVDGASPVSDQALLAAAQHQRELLVFGICGGEAHSVENLTVDTPSLVAADQDHSHVPVAVGIVGQGELDLVVSPGARGRGIGTAALHSLLTTEAAAASSGGDPDQILAWAHGENPAANALLQHAGFTPVRSLYRMSLDPALLPADGRDPLTLPTPQGFALRAFTPADSAGWVRANAAAFASHPEQGRITEADFALMREAAWFDPDDLILLTGARDEVIGSTWIKTVRESVNSPVETELYAVGVHPDFAGRGLGRLLLSVTLARMAQHDPAQVTLYVDGENTRAVQMYEAAGFTIDSRSRQWAGTPVSVANARMDA